MARYKYSKDDYHKLLNAPCIDVALALGMEINEKASDRKAWKMKNEQGLCIYREGNNWYRFSDGSHGFPLDLVVDKLGCTREQALDFIAQYVVNGVSEQVQFDDSKRRYIPKEPSSAKTFVVPPHDIKPSRVFAYLAKTRGIEGDIIKALLQRKLIAEDSAHHNCLFFGYDNNGTIRSCAVRGTNSAVQFRGETAGGNKAYTFSMAGKNNILRIFESPIDAMSHATFSKLLGKDWTADHRLSANGCGNYDCVKQYLDTHTEINSVWIAYDNDEGGRNGAAAAREKLLHDYPDRELDIHICYPVRGKDWNEDLQLFRELERSGTTAKEFIAARYKSNTFLYNGNTYEPLGYLPTGLSLSDIYSDITSVATENYNAADFERVKKTDAQLFLCRDTNQICLPMANEIYVYGGAYIPFDSSREIAEKENIEQDDDECDCEMG